MFHKLSVIEKIMEKRRRGREGGSIKISLRNFLATSVEKIRRGSLSASSFRLSKNVR